MDRDRKDISI